jgi:acyl-CoA synthetase (AMP-forming)/AMP-acid ligase II
VSQLSFFSAESVPPAVADLTGVLAAAGQVVLVNHGARLSVVVDRPWRAAAIAEMMLDAGLDPEITRTDEDTGQAICAFVILKASAADEPRENMIEDLRGEVAREISPIAKPREIHVVPELPKTRSGKIMRRLLRDVAEGRELGDTSTLVDPGVFEAIRATKAED